MEVKARKARLKDVPLLVELAVKLVASHLKFDRFYFFMARDAAKEYEKYFREKIMSRNWLCIVAEVNGDIVGYALAEIKKRPSIYKVRKSCELHDLFVEKRFRGRRISRQLFDEVHKFAKHEKVKLLQVIVNEKNKTAIEAYKRFGYKEFDKKMVMKIS